MADSTDKLSSTEPLGTAQELLGRNLTTGIVDSVGRTIVVGGFKERSFPIEADLATHFGVSRSITREALKMLTAKGLISARPRQGTVVQPETSWNLFDPDVLRWMLEREFSLTLLRQFTELRLSIEPAAAHLAANAATPDAVEAIRLGLARMARAEQGDGDPLEADIAFHVAVLAASGNPFYSQFRDVVRTALHTSIRFTNRFKGRTASLPAHRAVLDAISGHDAAAAHAAMLAIVQDVKVLIDQAGAQDGRKTDIVAD